MRETMFESFKDELAALADRLRVERAALESVEGEERAITVNRISTLEKLFAVMTSARNSIIGAEVDCDEVPKKFLRWRQFVAEARAAKEKLDEFTAPLEQIKMAIAGAEGDYQAAQFALGGHKNHPIENSDYSSPAALKKWEDRCNVLQGDLNAKSGKLRELKGKFHALQSGWMKAQQAFNDCAFRERTNRPPDDAPQKSTGFGVLSAIP